MSCGARWLVWMCGAAAPLAAQHAAIGPTLVLGDYREVSSSLRYQGMGPGVFATLSFHHFSLDGAAAWIQMDPAANAGGSVGFRATQLDGWARWNATDYLTLEAGVTKRSPDMAFAAQSVGAIRVGARTHYALGHGAIVSLRGDYLAGAQFSGGGRAPLSLELGLALDMTFSPHFRVLLDYSFQRFDRRTNPGGGVETKAPIEQALGRLGVAIGF